MKKMLLASIAIFMFISVINAQDTSAVYPPVDIKTIDYTLKPGDDFFEYVNRIPLSNTPIPPSKTRWGSFMIVREESSQALKQLLENAATNTSQSKTLQMIGDFYTSGMDSLAIEKMGYLPVKNDLDKIASITSIEEVIDAIAVLRTEGKATPLYGFSVVVDPKKTTQYVAELNQGGITLPDRDYYLKNDPKSANIRKEYKSYIADIFKLTGISDSVAIQNAVLILDLETKLAAVQLSRVELRDPVKTYNKAGVDALDKTMQLLKWKSIFQKMWVQGQDSFITNNPYFIRYIDTLAATTPVATWKVYLQWNILKNVAAYLSNDFVQRNFQFNKVLTGQKVIAPRWQRTSDIIDQRLGDLLGQLYVAKYFKPEAKQRMLDLVNNLMKTFADRIKNLDWMSDETKKNALIKLSEMQKKIAYPDKWKTYDGVVISNNDLIGNIRSSAQWNYNFRIKKLNTPVDKSEWNTTPQTVNAFYEPTANDITFPAGILQPPFFNFDADDAINYGAIGSIIGHEMTHGFDDGGRQFDGNGNLDDWWTAEDATKFKAKAKQMIDEYNSFILFDSTHVNGNLTLGENLADLGGINIAYQAFKNTAEGKSTTMIDGLTPDQRFFIGYAEVWRMKALRETQAQLITIDPHSPEKFRVDGIVNNLDAFYKAFNIQPGDKMYKPENERIKIW